jgi:hypothetical protein
MPEQRAPRRRIGRRDPWGEEATNALPPHPLQTAARVAYFGAAVGIAVWLVPTTISRRPPGGALFLLGLLAYTTSLGCTVGRVRPHPDTRGAFPFLMSLAVFHSFGGCAATWAFAVASVLRDSAPAPAWATVVAFYGVLCGPLPGLLLALLARRAGLYLFACFGGLVWLLVVINAF